MSWEENYDYAKISGTTFRPSIIAGLDIRINEKFGTFSVFFEAIAPAASYTIENLFGIGDYTQTGGMTFPTPRIGISLSDF
ncbi:MAG: hypothetical protein C0596_09080 [Marinilabiliales bacterium]|nr:MAG: hypothetical protein C0596_09080 [Marinilabiliales bacterium]